MTPEQFLRRAFLRRLVSTDAGRAHLLSLMVAAEEGDEQGVFEQLISKADDPELRKLVERHQQDEFRHAALFRACLERNRLTLADVPDELKIICQIARVAGGAFAVGLNTRSAAGIASREDIMNTYALLLAIEERGVQQFPLIGAEFRRAGDPQTADTFDQVAKDELRHTKYCLAIGPRYAPDRATWDAAVQKYRAIERRAFERVGRSGLLYGLANGLVFGGRFAKLVTRALPLRFLPS
jgi:hypothetical protein